VADQPLGPSAAKEPRYRVSIPVTVIRGIAHLPATCLDLSNEGMLVQLEEEGEAAEGELVRVEISYRDEPTLRLPTVITRRVRRKLGLLLFGVSGDPQQVWRALVSRIARNVEQGQRGA
jgi:hypothetical protein